MKKAAVLLCIISTSIFLFVSCRKESNAKPVVLTMAEVNPENSICGRMDLMFKNKVEELSGNTIRVDLKFSGVLGDEKDVLAMMFSKESSIDLARVSANLSAYGAKKSGIISIPYTFATPEHFWNFAKSDVAQILLEEPYELGLGVRGLCYAEEGFRNFFSTTKITSVKDIENKKMRVSGKVLTGLAEALGAEPVEIAFTDLYMAFQTGAVEIADQPVSNYLANHLHKVAPYMIMDNHMLGAVQIIIKSETWDKLSDKQKKIVKEAALCASEYCRTISIQKEREDINTLTKEGAQFVFVADNNQWQEACKELISQYAINDPALYVKIQNLK